MTGDGSQEMDHGRRMTINLLSDMQLPSDNRAQICRHLMYRQHGSTEYDSEHYSKITNYTAICPSYNAEYDPDSDPDSASVIPSHSYNADTIHLEAV
jgi:hypothetical protein